MSTLSKKYRLRNIRLFEVSKVDMPANQGAEFLILKRREPMDEDVVKQLTEAAGTIAGLQEKLEAAEARATAAEAATVVAKAAADAAAKAAPKVPDTDGDEILKGASPEIAAEIKKLRDQNTAAAKQLAKIDEEREIAKFVEVAEEDYGGLAVSAKDFGPILKRASATLDTEDFGELTRILKAASEGLSHLTRAMGFTGMVGPSDAEAQIDKKAKEKAAADRTSFHKAYTEVIRDHPDLYRQYLKETGQHVQ